MPPRPLCTVRLALGAAALVAAVGCADAPTGPLTLEMVAGGQGWMAVAAPGDLPTVSTWLPHLPPSEPGREAAARVRTLERQAAQARARGEFGRWSELNRQAGQLAVHSLDAAPPPEVMRASDLAVRRWLTAAHAIGVERAPLLRAALDSVGEAHASAARSLEGGDSLAAAADLMLAAEHIRRLSPAEIAWRVLGHAEARLRAAPQDAPGRTRARHLARSARQELATGDPVRALQRALYALQLIEGRGVSDGRADQPGDCVVKDC